MSKIWNILARVVLCMVLPSPRTYIRACMYVHLSITIHVGRRTTPESVYALVTHSRVPTKDAKTALTHMGK